MNDISYAVDFTFGIAEDMYDRQHLEHRPSLPITSLPLANILFHHNKGCMSRISKAGVLQKPAFRGYEPRE